MCKGENDPVIRLVGSQIFCLKPDTRSQGIPEGDCALYSFKTLVSVALPTDQNV